MCLCIDVFDEKLKQHNIKIATTTLLGPEMEMKQAILIQTEKLSKSRKPKPNVFASFCPFCGKSINTAEGAAAGAMRGMK